MAVRLLSAAKEFNVGKETVYEFLLEKGFDITNNPSAKLTEEMYNALQAQFAGDRAAKNRRDEIILTQVQGSLLENWRKRKLDGKSDRKTESADSNILGKINLEDMNLASRPKRGAVRKRKEVDDASRKNQLEPDPSNLAGLSQENKPEHLEIKAPKLKGPQNIGKIELPVSQSSENITSSGNRERRMRKPLDSKAGDSNEGQPLKSNNLNIRNREKSNSSKSPKEDIQKEIWRFYIQAKRKFIERLTRPIKIIPHNWELRENGIMRVEIDRTVNNKELYDLIRKYFTIEGVEPILAFQDNKLSHFTISTANAIDESRIVKFQEQSSAYYLDFSVLPVVEGNFTLKESTTSQFKEFCEAHNITIKKDRDGKCQLTLFQIRSIESYIEQNPSSGIKIGQNIGCVISIRPLGIINKLVQRYGPKMFTETRTSAKGFSITSKSFNRNLFSEIEWICRCKATYFIVTYSFSDEITDNLIALLHSKINIHDCIQDIFIERKTLIFKIPFNELNKGSFVFHTLYHYLSSKEINGKFHKIAIFYETQQSLLSGYDFGKNRFDEDLMQSIKGKLQNIGSLVDLNNNSISFDFSSEEELYKYIGEVQQLNSILNIDWRGQDHRMKVQIDFSNPFEELENKIKDRFRTAKTRFNELTGILRVTNHYKYSAETQNFIITQLKGFCEDLAQQYGFEFTLVNPYEIKLAAEVNEKLREYEENQKFQKLRMSDVSFNEKTIGKIIRCAYPIVEIKLNDIQIDFFEDIVSRDKSQFTYVKPELKGEIEKIFRLENAIAKIETDAKTLPNPKVAEYIYDSSKASEIKDPSQLNPGSNTWKEVLFHKNENSNLNESQIRGVVSSLLAEDLVLIQGPPGTGKSTAIAETIWQHIRRQPKQKILLTSETHLAVDNALEKIGKLKSNLIRPIRFGVEEDEFELEELTDDDTISKVEAEGRRYSVKRMKAWALAESDSAYYQKLRDNAVQNWLNKIAENSSSDTGKFPAYLKEKWVRFCSEPTIEIKSVLLREYIEHVNVIGATSSSIAEKNTEGKPTRFTYSYREIFGSTSRKNAQIQFDVVVTDEASKATPPELLLPLLFGKKSIIVGDHRQLPPMLDENDFETTLKNIGEHELARAFSRSNTNESQFERLFEGLHKNSTLRTTFDLQYRMHSSINEVIKQFYEKDAVGLNCGLDPIQENSDNLYDPQSRWHGLTSPGLIDENTHCLWVNVIHPEIIEGTSRVNWGEIDACKRILSLLKKAQGFEKFQNHWEKDEDKEIGLISFYGKQLNHLKRMASAFPEIPLRISTVDRFQGMERNIIIVSMVRSNIIAPDKTAIPDFDLYPDTQGFPKQDSLGFAELPNRLNVALSRAKRLLIIVGNVQHFIQKDIYANVYNVIRNSKYGKIIDDYKTMQV